MLGLTEKKYIGRKKKFCNVKSIKKINKKLPDEHSFFKDFALKYANLNYRK